MTRKMAVEMCGDEGRSHGAVRGSIVISSEAVRRKGKERCSSQHYFIVLAFQVKDVVHLLLEHHSTLHHQAVQPRNGVLDGSLCKDALQQDMDAGVKDSLEKTLKLSAQVCQGGGG